MPRAFNHVGIAVSDLARSVAFYKLLGYEESGPQSWRLHELWLDPLLSLEDVDMEVSYLALHGATLELLQFHQPPGRQAPEISLNNPGTIHLAIEVDDVQAEYERLSGEGVPFMGEPVTIPDGDLAGATFVFARDPDGNRVEFTTSAPV